MKLLALLTILTAVAPVIVLLPALLGSRKPHRTANWILAGTVLLMAAIFILVSLRRLGVWHEVPGPISIPLPFVFLIPPGLYLYIRQLLDPERPLRPAMLWHLVPFVLAYLTVGPWLFAGVAKRAAFFDMGYFSLRWFLGVGGIVSMASYLMASRRLVNAYEARVRDVRSEMDDFHLRRLRFFLTIYYVLLLMLTFIFLALGKSPYFEVGVFIASITLVCIAQYGQRYSPVFQTISAEIEATELASPAETEPPKYETSGLAQDDLEALSKRLLDHLGTSKCYAKSNLKLGDLARALHLSDYQMSQVINVGLKENFFALVNRYRIEEAKGRLTDGAGSENILDIAYAVGFNSKSSFNNAFKKIVGTTPSDYRRTVSPQSK